MIMISNLLKLRKPIFFIIAADIRFQTGKNIVLHSSDIILYKSENAMYITQNVYHFTLYAC